MSVVQPPIDDLLSRVDSKYTLCIISARRARQINDMLHGVRDQALLTMTASQVRSYTAAKPLSMALDEIESGDVSYTKPEEPEEA
jgi:DNA-directed RNA polymerase subunit omega